jgi:hypothetical protein
LGFTLDDERLKEGRSLGAGYFDELLERIRDIRASQRWGNGPEIPDSSAGAHASGRHRSPASAASCCWVRGRV